MYRSRPIARDEFQAVTPGVRNRARRSSLRSQDRGRSDSVDAKGHPSQTVASPLRYVASGSLLYIENCEPVVEWWTGESISHVAIIMNSGGQSWLYEATPPRVRRMKLEEYYHDLCKRNQQTSRTINVWLTVPRRPLSLWETAGALHYLNLQLHRPFSIQSYAHRRTGAGIHCGELVGGTLQRCTGFPHQHYHIVNPAEMMRKTSTFFHHPQSIALGPYTPTTSWRARSRQGLRDFAAWIKWYAEETWRMC